MINTDNLFKAIIDPEAAAASACPALRDTIVMTIVSNTAAKQRVPANGLEGLLEMAKEFSYSNIIVQRGTTYKEFRFEDEDGIHNMKMLTGLLVELKDASVEDTNHISYEGKEYYGFCWNECNEKSSGKPLFCGCYHLEDVTE